MSKSRATILFLGMVALTAIWWGPQLWSGESVAPAASSSEVSTQVDPDSGLPWVSVDQLPPEAAEVLALIDRGGPFRYRTDGAVFENRERLLPIEDPGYYHEYTVDTPGSPDRGARRIVVGSDRRAYWTDDHYQSFERIDR